MFSSRTERNALAGSGRQIEVGRACAEPMIAGVFHKIRSRSAAAREARRRKRRKEEELTAAVERVVRKSEAVLCSLRECRGKLRPSVDRALSHIEQTLALIPGPVLLSAENWDRDPLLRALFVTPGELTELLAREPRLDSFFTENCAEDATALLTAVKQERTVFATAAEGEIVRRDVAQTAVEFHDHRFIALAPTQAQSLEKIKFLTLNAMVAQVLERLLKLRALKEDLLEEKNILSVKLKIRQSQPTDGEASSPGPNAGFGRILSQLERRIQSIANECDSPQDCLRQIAQVLDAPQEMLQVRPISLRLNWMGVKQGGGSQQPAAEITLAEFEIKERLKRVAVLARISRQERRGR